MAGERRLHILGSIRGRLQMAQIDAIELACLDTWFSPHETDDVGATLERLAVQSSDMVLLDPATLVCLMEDHAFTPNEQVVLVVFERENSQLAPHIERLKNLRYLVGAHTPSMMRGVLGAILEHHASGAVRGLVPRLVSMETLHLQRRQVLDSTQRSVAQGEVVDFFQREMEIHADDMVGGTAPFPRNLGDVADELLMNAIWDANPARASIHRGQAVTLEPNEEVFVESRCDGLTLSLTVQDGHGSFPQRATFRPIKFALGFREEATISQDTAGAGIGLFMSLQKLTALSIEVEHGRCTRVTAVLRGDQSLRDTQRRPRTILFFQR